MFFTEQENLTYVPVSSIIILLVILLTCASRKRKSDPFSSAEQSLENDIQGDYAVMCFPCLKKKPELNSYEPTADLSDQFEYIVEKYTIRKVPLLLANTAEDLREREEELELAEMGFGQPESGKDDFVNFQLGQDVFNVQRVPPCITVAANTVCPGRKGFRDRSKPSDVLESMSPIPRPNVKNTNYVVIPTKGSLRSKDIMMTKREITNQYLNNFSSVFVDNLKDQVPKDPEQFPNLSRPYTSAFKNLPFAACGRAKSAGEKKSKKMRPHKVAYAFSAENEDGAKMESFIREEEEPYWDSDSGSKGQTTDALESESQENNENYPVDLTDKSKSFVLTNESDSAKEMADSTANPFKAAVKSSSSELADDSNPFRSTEDNDSQRNPFGSPKDDRQNAKVTYEDIQALDVGYEFTSCEKLGVKPKRTRIHYPHEGERSKESKLTGEPKSSRKSFSAVDQVQVQQSPSSIPCRIPTVPKQSGQQQRDMNFFEVIGRSRTRVDGPFDPVPKEKASTRSLITETSFLPKIESSSELTKDSKEGRMTNCCEDFVSTTTFTSKSEGSKSRCDLNVSNGRSETVRDSVTEISDLYDIAMPVNRIGNARSACQPQHRLQQHRQREQTDAESSNSAKTAKSRSFQEPIRGGPRRENAFEVLSKGNDKTSEFPVAGKRSVSGLEEREETETSSSLRSRESKTSSVTTSPRSSERNEGKRATLRWKIVIKHHRDEDSSRKNPNKAITKPYK